MRTWPAAAMAAALALGGCGSDASPDPADGDRLAVAATTTQVADLVRNVGGDKVAVTQLLKPNVDPHDYEPAPADVTAVGRARVLVKNGVGLESWLDDTVTASGFSGTTVDASKGVRLREGHGHEEAGHSEPAHEDEAGGDPHIWHDPRNAKIMAENIKRALVAADKADASTYEANFTGYAAQLDQLDTEIEAKLRTLPAERRKLVTNHDTFGYYVDRYGLEFVGSIIPSFDTSAELSARDIDDIVAKIRQAGVRAVFSESSLPPKTAEAIGRQAGVVVVSGEDALYADTLGPAGSAGDTYLKMMRHNTETIVKALGA